MTSAIILWYNIYKESERKKKIMRTFNSNTSYIIEISCYPGGRKFQTRKFKTEQSLQLFGNSLAKKKNVQYVYIQDPKNRKQNFWHFS